MSRKSDIRDILDEIQKRGFAVEQRKKTHHWKVTAPNGEITFTSSTPSDHRTIRNFRAWVKRQERTTR